MTDTPIERLIAEARSQTASMQYWGVDESRVNYRDGDMGRFWLIKHLADELEAARAARADYERTVKSIAAMLGWENVPPQHVLEAEIRALKARVLVGSHRMYRACASPQDAQKE